MLDSIVCDYIDAEQNVTFARRVDIAVTARPQALRRVVGNLVDNALKFSGAAELEVTLTPEGHAEVAVLDRGPGIPEESLEAVFEPFVRIETSRNRGTGGTGLGLAIARQLTQAMDAALVLRNRAGGGLEARLTLKVQGARK